MNVILTTLKTADLILKSFTVLLDLEKYTRCWATTLSPNSAKNEPLALGYLLNYSI